MGLLHQTRTGLRSTDCVHRPALKQVVFFGLRGPFHWNFYIPKPSPVHGTLIRDNQKVRQEKDARPFFLREKMHVLENEQLMTIFFCGKIVHMILLTKTGCKPTSLRTVNLSTINCDAVDWTTYLQTSVRGGGFYKDFAVMLGTHRKNPSVVPGCELRPSAKLILPTPWENLCYQQTPAICKEMLALARMSSRKSGTQIMYF